MGVSISLLDEMLADVALFNDPGASLFMIKFSQKIFTTFLAFHFDVRTNLEMIWFMFFQISGFAQITRFNGIRTVMELTPRVDLLTFVARNQNFWAVFKMIFGVLFRFQNILAQKWAF